LILVGIVVNKREIKVVSRFSDESMDTAIALGEDIVAHQRVKVVIGLKSSNDEKSIILKRIRRNWLGKVTVR